MQITYIETSSITNEVLRAYAGAHRLCVGYPDGVPETWRDVAPMKQGGDAAGSAAPGKCVLCFFDGEPVCRKCGAVAESNSRSTYPIDPAALLGPAAEPVDWPEDAGGEEC